MTKRNCYALRESDMSIPRDCKADKSCETLMEDAGALVSVMLKNKEGDEDGEDPGRPYTFKLESRQSRPIFA